MPFQVEPWNNLFKFQEYVILMLHLDTIKGERRRSELLDTYLKIFLPIIEIESIHYV